MMSEEEEKKREEEKEYEEGEEATATGDFFSTTPLLDSSALHKSSRKPRPRPPPPTPSLNLIEFQKLHSHSTRLLPSPNTKSFSSKPLGSVTWSPRHQAVARVTRNLPAYSSLVRQSAADPNRRPSLPSTLPMHRIAVPIAVSLDDLSASAGPLRQKIYEPTDLSDPSIDASSSSIFSAPNDRTTLSVFDGDAAAMMGFKVTVLTPAMTQFAKLPAVGGRLMGRGGVQFLAKGVSLSRGSGVRFCFRCCYCST